MNTACPDLRGKQRTKAVPPIPHGLMADLDAALEQEIFDLSQRQRVSDIQHHREADHFGRTVEITERIVHHRRLRGLTFQLKPIYSDNARGDANRRRQRPCAVSETLPIAVRSAAGGNRTCQANAAFHARGESFTPPLPEKVPLQHRFSSRPVEPLTGFSENFCCTKISCESPPRPETHEYTPSFGFRRSRPVPDFLAAQSMCASLKAISQTAHFPRRPCRRLGGGRGR